MNKHLHNLQVAYLERVMNEKHISQYGVLCKKIGLNASTICKFYQDDNRLLSSKTLDLLFTFSRLPPPNTGDPNNNLDEDLLKKAIVLVLRIAKQYKQEKKVDVSDEDISKLVCIIYKQKKSDSEALGYIEGYLASSRS